MRTTVPRLRTPLSAPDLRLALCAGHRLAFEDVEPSPPRLALAWAMAALEHGHGSALWCWNVGNIDAAEDWTGDVFPLTADELVAGARVPRTKLLRAYPSAEEGAAGYWRFLAGERWQPDLFAAFDAGDPATAAHRLKLGRYYTAPEASYAAAMSALFLEYHRRWPAHLL